MIKLLRLQVMIRDAEPHWLRLTKLQRYGAAIAVGIVAIAVVVAGLIMPIGQFSRSERARLDAERELLALISQHADRFRQINDARQQKSGSDTSLLALASRTAADHGLSIYRSEPGTSGELTLWLSSVDFNLLLTWLEQLTSQYHIRIERLQVGQSGPAIVEVQVVLR